MKLKVVLFTLIFSVRLVNAQWENKPLLKIKDNTQIVVASTLSNDSKILATAGMDLSISLWDIETGKQISLLKGVHSGGITGLIFDTESKRLVSVGKDAVITVWDIENRKVLRSISHAHDQDIKCVAIERFNNNIITGSVDRKIKIWDINTGALKNTLIGHDGEVYSIMVNNTNNEILSSSSDMSMRVWNVNKTDAIKQIPLQNSIPKAISLSQDGAFWAVGNNTRSVEIWKNDDMRMDHSIDFGGVINQVEINGDGNYLFVSTKSGSSFVYNIKENIKYKIPVGQEAKGMFTMDGKRLVVSELSKNVSIFDISSLNIKPIEVRKLPVASITEESLVTYTQTIAAKSEAEAQKKEAQAMNFDPAEEGKNYLLLIAINDYRYWPPLNNAVKDAQDVKNILISKYGFVGENIIEIRNQECSLEGLHNTFKNMRTKISPRDNLIIYFSGHGFYNKELEEGYWVPVDARKGKEIEYFSNSSLLKYIKAIDTKHIFLVADACFSGSLFAQGHRGYVENVSQYKSRWALTSGRLEYVSDGRDGKNSPFAQYFIQFLQTNSKEAVTVSEVIQFVKVAVSNNSEQTPMGNPLKNVGDEGGEFIFKVKKD